MAAPSSHETTIIEMEMPQQGTVRRRRSHGQVFWGGREDGADSSGGTEAELTTRGQVR